MSQFLYIIRNFNKISTYTYFFTSRYSQDRLYLKCNGTSYFWSPDYRKRCRLHMMIDIQQHAYWVTIISLLNVIKNSAFL